jgi:hypothetical protein
MSYVSGSITSKYLALQAEADPTVEETNQSQKAATIL